MRILVFGASIVQGFHDSERGGWVSRLAAYGNEKILNSQYDSDPGFFNLGISGDCTNRLLKRFEFEAKTRLEGRRGAIVISIGINDTQRYVETGELKTSERQYEENVKELITISKKYANKVVILGLLPIVEEMVQPMPWAQDRSHSEKDVLAFDQILKKVCEGESIAYFHMQNVYGEERKKYLHDGIHPNAEGHQLIFERVRHVLEKEGIL